MVATGGAHRERKYYSNDGSEVMFVFQNPCVVSGISELPERPDLLDRSIVVHLDAIGEKDRRTEDSFNREFEAARPRMLGALLEVVVAGLAKIDSVKLPNKPRMADFCRWGCAIEVALGYQPGSFLEAYGLNLADANAAALEASSIAWAMHQFIGDRPEGGFTGSANELLRDLNGFVGLHAGTGGAQPLALKHPKWPKSASALSAEISRIEPNLQNIGVAVTRSRTKAKRLLHLEAVAQVSGGETTDGRAVISKSKQNKRDRGR
jgi:hypothetical protein